jgi:hypothetical protein
MTANEIAATFKLQGEQRLAQFVEAVRAGNSAYGISDEEGWALLGDNDDTDILPLFQNAALAEAFRAAAGFEGNEVEEIGMEELLEWLAEMDEDGTLVAVCPNARMEGAVVEPSYLAAELQKN